MKIAVLLSLAIVVAAAGPVAAQPSADERRTVESLERKIAEIERRHQEEMNELRGELEALKHRVAAAEDTAAESERMPAQAPAQRSSRGLNAFNPRITVFGNFLGRVDDKPVLTESGDAIDDSFNLREAELDFRGAIDPWADGVLILSAESEVPGSYTTAIEEGYVDLKRLPVLDSAPGGLKLRVGRFRPDFGRFNKVHLHDLPQTTYPLALESMFGEGGLIGNGLAGEVFLPTWGDSNVLSANLSLINGGGSPINLADAGGEPAYLGHLKWFWDVAGGSDLELGSSFYAGPAGDSPNRDARLYGLDFSYKWQPYSQGQWRSFILAGELFSGDIDAGPGANSTPLSYYLWTQYQLGHDSYFGLRYDTAQEIDNNKLDTSRWGAFLTYYTSEFLRFRLGYEHTLSDIAELDGLDTASLEMNFVLGSHPVEPYWVNR